MKLTSCLTAFVEKMADIYVKHIREDGISEDRIPEERKDAVKEYSAQIIENDAACLVRFALDEGIEIPKELVKYKEKALQLF